MLHVPTRVCISLSVNLPTYIFIYHCLPVYLNIYLDIHSSAVLSTWISICLRFTELSFCHPALYVHMFESMCASILPSTYLCIRLSTYQSHVASHLSIPLEFLFTQYLALSLHLGCKGQKNLRHVHSRDIFLNRRLCHVFKI